MWVDIIIEAILHRPINTDTPVKQLTAVKRKKGTCRRVWVILPNAKIIFRSASIIGYVVSVRVFLISQFVLLFNLVFHICFLLTKPDSKIFF